MKKLTIKLFFVVAMMCAAKLYAQEADLFSAMEPSLTSEEKGKVTSVKSSFKKAKDLESQIKEEDAKLAKNSSKKAKKNEKKAVDVKTLRIKQGLLYEQGYSNLYKLYVEKVRDGVFIYDEDEKKVDDLLKSADTDNSSAGRKMKPYKSVTPKDLKKSITYSKLKSDLEGVNSLFESAIKKLIEAYTVIGDQEQKKQLEDEENRSWQNAQSENTIYGYQNYISEYPSGKYVSEAKAMIADLEEIEKKKLEDSKSREIPGDLFFHVQIAASKTQLPDWKLKKIYPKGVKKDIVMKFYDEWHKYSVGQFKKYSEAKAFVKNTGVRGAFVVAYKGDTKLDIREAKELVGE